MRIQGVRDLKRQLNNILLLAFLMALTLSLFSAARYTEASIYINDLSARYQGLSVRESDSAKVRKQSVVDKKLEKEMAKGSTAFIKAAFSHDENTISSMLGNGAEYVCAADGSSFIRYVSDSLHVEGYMATNKALVKVKQKWCVRESSGTVISGMSVYIKGINEPQRWYIHYRKAWGKWKIYMLENGI